MSNVRHSVRLNWPGKDAPRPATEAELELVRRGHPSTVLIHGDNLVALRALSERAPAAVALAYLDPPFFTGRLHARVVRTKTRAGRVVRSLSPAFDDRWDGLDQYLSALADRVAAVRDLLAPHGSIVIHVDPKTSHYVKVLCDEVFGQRCFASEIVWRYRRWPAKTQNFQRVHDVLLRYVRDPDTAPRFHQLYEPLAPSTMATWGKTKQRAVVDGRGHRLRSSSTAELTPGAPLGDVWDIGIVAPVSRERTGYPTQKPEALLVRLIEACSEAGDLVLDPYVGSGTTLAVCARLGRRAIGVDINPEALQIARKRLRALGERPLEERAVPVVSAKTSQRGGVEVA
jgi:DNA modification methylase